MMGFGNKIYLYPVIGISALAIFFSSLSDNNLTKNNEKLKYRERHYGEGCLYYAMSLREIIASIEEAEIRLGDLYDYHGFDGEIKVNDVCHFLSFIEEKEGIVIPDFLNPNAEIKEFAENAVKGVDKDNLEDKLTSLYLTFITNFKYDHSEPDTPSQMMYDYKKSSFWGSRRMFTGDCVETQNLFKLMGQSIGLEIYFAYVIEDELGRDMEKQMCNVDIGSGHMCLAVKMDYERYKIIDLTQNHKKFGPGKGLNMWYKKVKILNDVEALSIFYAYLCSYADEEDGYYAQKICKEGLIINPESALLHNFLGYFHAKRYRFEDAFEETRISVEKDPNNFRYLTSLGNILFNMGKLDDAEEEFKKAIRICPKYAYAHYHLGLFYQRKGRSNQAEKEFKLAVKYRPNYTSALDKLKEISNL